MNGNSKSPPCRKQREKGRAPTGHLERKFRRQLNSARSAAAQKRIANTHISGGHNLICAVPHFTISVYVKSAPAARRQSWRRVRRQCQIRRRIGDKRRQFWIREIWMIENVEKLRA